LGCNNLDGTKNTSSKANESKETSILNETNLASQFFKIDIHQDNTLITNSGVVIQLPIGCIESDINPIELEIKEAITIKDIFLAGLETHNNELPLSSGGMIYINAKQRYNIKIKQGIKVQVPTEVYNNKMQLFDGVKDSNGLINWINPTPLLKNNMTKKLDRGEQLFKSNCSSCHNILKDATGPMLHNIHNRRSLDWIYKFTRNSTKQIGAFNESRGDTATARDIYATCIYNKWKKTNMTAFPNLSTPDLNAIYSYIKNVSDMHPELNTNIKTPCDSCEVYQNLLYAENIKLDKIIREQNEFLSLKQKIEFKKNILKSTPNTKTEVFNNVSTPSSINPSPVLANPIPNSPAISLVPNNINAQPVKTPELNYGTYYDIEITTFGWKNIDVLMKNVDGNLESILFARIQESSSFKVRVQLLIPSLKVSLAATRKDIGSDLFEFNNTYKTYLPQGVTCYLVAIAEKDSDLYFGIQDFVATTNQTIDIKFSKSSTSEINNTLNNLNIKDLVAKVRIDEKVAELNKYESEIKLIEEKIKLKSKK
jgi:cytochrome c2